MFTIKINAFAQLILISRIALMFAVLALVLIGRYFFNHKTLKLVPIQITGIDMLYGHLTKLLFFSCILTTSFSLCMEEPETIIEKVRIPYSQFEKDPYCRLNRLMARNKKNEKKLIKLLNKHHDWNIEQIHEIQEAISLYNLIKVKKFLENSVDYCSKLNREKSIYPDISDFRYKEFRELLTAKNEVDIIKFLEEHLAFTDDYLSYIMQVIFLHKLPKVAQFLYENFEADLGVQILYAGVSGDIPTIKELTFFEKFLNGDTITHSYIKQLEMYNVPLAILDKIIIFDAINYRYENGNHWLQSALRKRDFKNVDIQEFIERADSRQLNAQETQTGSTALHVAAELWSQSKQKDDIEGIAYQEVIIQSLLEHGADPFMFDYEHRRAIDLSFFSEHNGQWQEHQAQYNNRAQARRSGIKFSTHKGTRYKVIAIGIAGIITALVGYKFLAKSKIKQAIKTT